MRGNELCRIAFSIDQEEQEITVYQNSSLDSLSQTLTNRLVAAGGTQGLLQLEQMGIGQSALKREIKGQLQQVIEEGSQQEKDGNWSKRLRQIIQDRPNGTSCSGPITYFGNQCGSGSKQAELYCKLKNRQKDILLNCTSKEKDRIRQGFGQRLFDNGRNKQAIKKQYGSTCQRQVREEQLSECTFHPNFKKSHSRGAFFSIGEEDVFSRLYNEAKQKRDKLVELERQVSERQRQQVDDMRFVPTINNSSKRIVRDKKIKEESLRSIYQQLYEDMVMQEAARPNRSKNKSPVPSRSSASTTRFPDETSRTPQRMVKHSQSSARLFGVKDSHSPSLVKQMNKVKKSRERLHTCESFNDYHSDTSKVMEEQKDQPQPGVFRKNREKKYFKTIDQKVERQKTMKTLQDSNRINTCQSESVPSKARLLNPLQFFKKQEEEKENATKGTRVVTSHPQIRTKEQIDSVFERRRMHIFETIFSVLLSKSHLPQQITFTVLRESKCIPQAMRVIFEPMAQQMQQLNVGLDRQEFVWSLNRIFDGLSSQSRGGLLAWGLTLQPQQPMSFR